MDGWVDGQIFSNLNNCWQFCDVTAESQTHRQQYFTLRAALAAAVAIFNTRCLRSSLLDLCLSQDLRSKKARLFLPECEPCLPDALVFQHVKAVS